MLTRPVVMLSLLSTGFVFGGVRHIAPDVECHEHPAATHFTGLNSSSSSVDSVEGRDGLPDGHSHQQHVLASNAACSPHSIGAWHMTSTPGCAFEHLIDQHVRIHTYRERPHRQSKCSTLDATDPP